MREDVFAAAIGGLSGASSRRLSDLLEVKSPEEAFESIVRGTVEPDLVSPDILSTWTKEIAEVDLSELSKKLDANECRVTTIYDEGHPIQLRHDIDPAPVLFCRGNIPAAELPHVAIVGTRRASSIGKEVARELGFGLAKAGVVVVSGLALGIDGEAHRGALLAGGTPPLAVVGSGIDVAYPKRNADLWQQIAGVGALVSEAPLGAMPEPWRFPARNRLIAAFSDLVVVVESRSAGGSLLTVEQALRRDLQVMAVPGSVRNKAADGTNSLLADGCAPARDVTDILVALGLTELDAAERRALLDANESQHDSSSIIGLAVASGASLPDANVLPFDSNPITGLEVSSGANLLDANVFPIDSSPITGPATDSGAGEPDNNELPPNSNPITGLATGSGAGLPDANVLPPNSNPINGLPVGSGASLLDANVLPIDSRQGAEAIVGRNTAVFEAIDDGPTSFDSIAERSGLGMPDVTSGVGELVEGGWVAFDGSRVRRKR